jgi:hypothetical protein
MQFLQHLRVLLIILMTAISGCIPAYYTYWAPAAAGGRLFNSAAAGSVAPSDSIEFVFDGVRVQLSGHGTEVGMVLRIPEGHSATFTSDEVEFLDAQMQAPSRIKFSIMSIDKKSPLIDLHFKPTDILTIEFNRSSIMLPGPEHSYYMIKLPKINVDGRIYTVPEIEFQKKGGFGVGL